MNIKLNQEVIIVGIGNCARYSTPIHKGFVNKIGRKWFEVDTENYVGKREKFSLEDGKSDGGNFMSEWRAFESEDAYNEHLNKPGLNNLIVNSLKGLSFKDLEKVYDLIKLLNLNKL
jgi:hypothetical protein